VSYGDRNRFLTMLDIYPAQLHYFVEQTLLSLAIESPMTSNNSNECFTSDSHTA
jgi:hypothetical protein